MGKEMTMYEQAMKFREQDLEQSIQELEHITEAHKDKTHFLSQESYKLGIKYCIRQIEKTELLYIKAHKELPYANPKEADREHKNQMSNLGCLKASFIRRYKGQA